MCASATNTSFVLLGRAQTVEETWLYLEEKGIRAALLSISPFDLQAAKKYIDSISGVPKGSPHESEYNKARDIIVAKLSRAFREDNRQPADFLSFIGYPPVLDAIGTLLKDELNYFKLAEDLAKSEHDQNEVALLLTVTNRILLREKNEKVIPNIVNSLLEDYPSAERADIVSRIFSPEEQCLRILHVVLGARIHYQAIPDKVLNDRYESALKQWFPEHPFLLNGKIRNAVFEALVMSIVLDKWGNEYADQVSAFASGNKGNYHLVYVFDRLSQAKMIPIACIGTFIDAAMEFNTRASSVQLDITGPSVDDLIDDTASLPTPANGSNIDIDLQIDFQDESSTGYFFSSSVSEETVIRIRNGLQSTSVTVPCGIELSSSTELHLSAPVEIHCGSLRLQAPHLLLTTHGKKEDFDILLDCSTIYSSVEKLTANGIAFNITVDDKTTLPYPLANYAAKRGERAKSKDQEQKYLRLKRIVVEFRSHSRGRLARLRAKIESARVLKNATGEAVLRRLITDGVLTPEGIHYFINPDIMSQKLGISWVDLRRGMTTEKLDRYLYSIR